MNTATDYHNSRCLGPQRKEPSGSVAVRFFSLIDGLSETVLFIRTRTFSLISVTACIKLVLDLKIKHAAEIRAAFVACNVTANHGDTVIAGVEDVVCFERYAEIVVKESLIKFGIHVGRVFAFDI